MAEVGRGRPKPEACSGAGSSLLATAEQARSDRQLALTEAFSRRQIMPQLPLGFGQPLPRSRLVRAGTQVIQAVSFFGAVSQRRRKPTPAPARRARARRATCHDTAASGHPPRRGCRWPATCSCTGSRAYMVNGGENGGFGGGWLEHLRQCLGTQCAGLFLGVPSCPEPPGMRRSRAGTLPRGHLVHAVVLAAPAEHPQRHARPPRRAALGAAALSHAAAVVLVAVARAGADPRAIDQQ